MKIFERYNSCKIIFGKGTASRIGTESFVTEEKAVKDVPIGNYKKIEKADVEAVLKASL